MPVNWLKLMAFAFGAAVAALTGTLVTALNGSVFPQTFEFPLLITDLHDGHPRRRRQPGGRRDRRDRDQRLLEVLREPGDSRFLFYALVARSGSSARSRLARGSRRRSAARSSSAFAAARARRRRSTGAGSRGGERRRPARRVGERVGRRARRSSRPGSTPVSYVGLVAAVLALTVLRGRLRLALLVPTLYLAAFVWENVMLARPEPTRFVILGAILIAVMIARPEGSSARSAWRSCERDGRKPARAARRLDGVRRPQVIDGLDLDVREGEIVSVIGPNGAGKTTLFNLVTGIYEPTDGDILLRRQQHRRPRAAPDHPARDRAHLPDAAPVPEHERARERDGGGVRAHQGRRLPRDAADARPAPRGAGDPRARREAARVLRRAADGLPLGSARVQPLVRQPAAARDRARDGDQPAAAPARRAGGRDESGRDARDHRADRQAPHRGRLHDPRDRARHARRRGDLGPRDRARPRREDRRRLVRRGRDRPRASSRRTSGTKAAERSERAGDDARAAAPASTGSTPTTA